MRGTVWGSEGERNTGGVEANTHRRECPQEEGRQSREMSKSTHRMESGKERGRRAWSRFPRKTTKGKGQRSEEPDMGQAGTAGEDEPHGPEEGETEIQTERKEKGEHELFLAPDATPERAPCRRRVPGGRCQYHNPS